MRKLFLIIFVVLLSFSCQKKEAVIANDNKDSIQSDTTKSKEFEMYTMSEMAGLMEQMYVQNLSVKEKIAKGEALGEFPDYYMKIHTAKFTDSTDNDLFFKTNAKLYIESQKKLYSDLENQKKNYNAGVDACITCHENKCGGPIPKIKKLYLK